MGLKRKKTESNTTLSLPYLLLLLFHLALTIPPASTTTTVAPSLLPRAVTTETATGGTVTVWPGVTQAILARDTTFSCTLILVLDAASPVASSLPQSLEASTHGAAVVMVVDKEESNLTDSLTHLLPLARQVRLRSWCTRVVVVSSDVAFLAAFARWSLRSRLLVWAARLVVLTSLPPPLLLALLPSSWTFAWMNAVFVNVQDATAGARYDVYAFLPFSPAGARVARVASWTKRGGLVQRSHLPLFPDKYSSFHGAEINVTARKYLPFWGEEEVEGATDPAAKQFYGPDYHQLKAVAQALNFTFRVVPAESWEMVEDLVESRVCLLVGVGYIVLSTRLKRHDYTITFLLDGNTFVMARPSFKSDWLAVFRPLSMHLWAGVLGSLLLVSVVLWVLLGKRTKQMTSRTGRQKREELGSGRRYIERGREEGERDGREEELEDERRTIERQEEAEAEEEENEAGKRDHGRKTNTKPPKQNQTTKPPRTQPQQPTKRNHTTISFGGTLHTLTGLLVGQGFPQRLTATSSSRLVVATWLIFAYVVVSVYNGNLTATLTVPAYPPRPETLSELVAVTQRLTMKSYLTGLCEVLLKSSSPIQNAVAQKMVVVSSTEEALQGVLTEGEAYVDNNSFLRYTIAERFTRADGTSDLYLVRERVFPSYLGLLVPHDAPYTRNLDLWLQAIVESGLYIKWTDDVVRQIRVQSQQRRRKDAAEQEEEAGGEAGAGGSREDVSEGSTVALNPTHLQGAFAVLFCGVTLALIAFVLEVTSKSVKFFD